MGCVALGALVDESAGFLKTSLPSSVNLDVLAEPGSTLTVHGNEGQLQQVLMNLGANARDAIGPGGGRLSIRVERREIDRGTVASHGILQKGVYVCVEVADSGPGMSLELQQRVFDPFFTTKGPGEGTGMGLALVYGIIQSHGGAIDLRSTPDQGSTFSLYLPALDVTLLDQARPHAEDGRTGPEEGEAGRAAAR
jgi:signal transduction histidine kinase